MYILIDDFKQNETALGYRYEKVLKDVCDRRCGFTTNEAEAALELLSCFDIKGGTGYEED